jgi:anion-transporting  ArsA/GET3 family ATPase
MPSTSEAPSIPALFRSKKILICCGSGGVGKTTTAAALGLQASALGLKTIVLTIDPAKRLANSLGIEKIDFQERQIPKADLKRAGIDPKAPLFAMMLDTKHTFDALIRKYAADSKKARSILDNKLYHHLSNMIGGSQEYMAMEKLYEIDQERDYELIILDTPPSRHALDFLEAPGKMKAMIGDSIMKWFLKPSLFVSRTSLKILERPMQRIFKAFDTVAGFEFLQDLSELLLAVSELLTGFQERAEKVQAILRDPRSSFLLISSPQPIPLQEAAYFYQKIRENNLPFAGMIFNRFQNLPAGSETPPAGGKRKAKEEWEEVRRLFVSLHRRDENELRKFIESLELNPAELLLVRVPQMDHDVHDLEGLKELGELLVS